MSHEEDVLLASGGFTEVGSTNLFPSLSEPGPSFQFPSTNGQSDVIPREVNSKKKKATKKHSEFTKHERSKEKGLKGMKDFRYKYRRLRRRAKEFVFVNAALSDEISYTEQLLIKAKAERKFLLKKLFHYLPMTENQALQSSAALKSLAANFHGNLPPTVLGPVHPSTMPRTQGSKKKQKSKRSDKKKKDSKSKQGISGEKPKRKKPGTAMKRKVQPIPVNEDGGPEFPIILGGLTVHDLGEIVYDRVGFHSERYIWPVGYCSSRMYPSMITPENRVMYTCKILDGGSEPVFEITPEDCQDQPITASTATACHCAVLRRLNKARGKETTNTGSGPEFFGYSHPTVHYLIQCIADACGLEKYKWVKFELPAKGPVPFVTSREDVDMVAMGQAESDGSLSESEEE